MKELKIFLLKTATRRMKAGRTGAEAQRRRQNGSARGEKKGREEREGRGLKKGKEAKIEKKKGKGEGGERRIITRARVITEQGEMGKRGKISQRGDGEHLATELLLYMRAN